MADFGHKADVLFVYITEAHAVDEWPIGSRLKYSQPKTTAERCTIARDFVSALDVRIPLLVDTDANSFETKYAAWPIRFYIILDGLMALIANPKQCTYDVVEIRHW
eukprot:CAMPEP_0184676646 /NCGR_PEP_ID=MMETSP0308-20130426/88461_1 /TAXON_ID=38269 /ORGANISM="Gloeochaete witrockiana, Strain SAG 46.84" /LENGTH=105 /DNA_ID=CAMNT_0027124491 /DNA_START=314 /DNA_END=628 /DNA_ORIENTATION=-